MRKIVFNGDGLVSDNLFGIHRYEYQILKQLDKMIGSSDIVIQLLVPSNIKCNLNFENIEIIRYGKKFPGSIGKLFWQQVIFPIYLFTKNSEGVDMTLALPVLKCDFVTLYDCIIENFPENSSTFREKLFRKLYLTRAKSISKGNHNILTVSEESKKEIIKFYNVTPEKINVVPCGWEHMPLINSDASVLNEYKCLKSGNYFFSLGSKYKHKNFSWVINIAKKHPQYYFVITGANYFSASAKELENVQLNNVIFTGYISDEKIKALMLNCKALIQPSIYEGFGLPPLEALSLGKSIIVSNRSCMPEIYGESAHYIDPYNYNINLDELLKNKVSNGNEILLKYSWEKSAKILLNLFMSKMN